MKFHETRLPGVFEIRLEPHIDERGFFARSWCKKEFESHNLEAELAQCSLSVTHRKHTLRGIHYQSEPYPEAKLVRCTRGSIYDVVVDLRRDSPSFKEWIAVVLSATNRHMVYIPPGCGHGFLSLEDDTELFYQMSQFFHPELARGARWDDPSFRIAWPAVPALISERDRTYPDFD